MPGIVNGNINGPALGASVFPTLAAERLSMQSATTPKGAALRESKLSAAQLPREGRHRK
jgi:hypothetical protein